jgi:hypothetical protein
MQQQLSKEYLILFNAITDAETVLKNLWAHLILAQQKAEEIYINSEMTLCPPENSFDVVNQTIIPS